MRRAQLEELCSAIIDCPHSTPKWQESGIPVIRNFNLNNSYVNLDGGNVFYVDEETYEQRIRRAVPEAGDVVISREAPMGVVGLIPEGMKCCMGQRLVLLKVKRDKCSPQYLLHALASEYVQTQIRRIDTRGSIVSNIDLDTLRELEIPIVENQQEVASLLDSIDSKIETNGKIIAELESLARTIYDYWFTQFDFPDENGNPYRSSGGSMVHNDTLHRDIPEGWRVGRLSDISHFVDDKRSCLGLSADNYISTDNMVKNRGGIVPSEYLPTEGTATNYKENDVLLSNIRPYFKKIWQADRMGGCCADVLVFRANNIGSSTWLYYTISSDHFFSYVSAGTKGSKMPRGDKEHMLRYEIPIPPVTLLSAYSQLVHPMNLKTAELHRESAKLTALRDWLLPLLMNGQAVID
ncbi:restriction endonuclease subunit S [Bifidobacterium jacchi]|uniref:Restriction endonuclease subunit S n=1 Tax=Bifidobacterium jacchi TaxID=2490545 RepID=A0A5N5RGI9_9BIFI|nr:restriction endonuclease subunit S [Bifidobacterium jacchi]KAB5606386.1 restriction endonuclease subunit S [Bifidobacterium jacchi]